MTLFRNRNQRWSYRVICLGALLMLGIDRCSNEPLVISEQTGWNKGKYMESGVLKVCWYKGDVAYTDEDRDGRINYRHETKYHTTISLHDTNSDGFFDTEVESNIYVGEFRRPLSPRIRVPWAF